MFSGADNIVFPYATRSTLPSDYVAYNNVPFGATHYKDKLFITLPRRRPGVPATLNYISLNAPKGSSPSLRGFPNYELNALHVINFYFVCFRKFSKMTFNDFKASSTTRRKQNCFSLSNSCGRVQPIVVC